MSIGQLQKGLQDIYELRVDHDIADFLITSREIAGALDRSAAFRNVKEKLLVQQDEDGLRLSLYLHPDVLAALDRNESLQRLHARDLGDYCLALEGVSHFLYLTWNATRSRCVTLLEMELQAEIDKFVMLSRYIGSGGERWGRGNLIGRLFRSVSFHEELGEAERRRYLDANQFALQYCRRLEEGLLRTGDRRRILNELRRFYRLPERGKLEHIGQLQ